MTVVEDRGLPAGALLRLLLGLLVVVVPCNLVPRDPLAEMGAIGRPTDLVVSVGFPTHFLSTEKGKEGQVIPREDGEVRVFFVGASETYALPYSPPGWASYGYHLGAAYEKATGRDDVHIRAEGNPALDSPQIVMQAKKVLEYGDPSLIVLVVGANEYLNRLVHGRPLLPDSWTGRVAAFCGGARQVFDWCEERLRNVDAMRPWLHSENERGVDSFVALTRQASPGKPALRGFPIGARDRALLMERLRAQVGDLHRACKEKGCKLAVALSLHGYDGSPPWCSVLEPGPPEIEALLDRVRADPAAVPLAGLQRWLDRYPERADLVHARAKVWRAAGNPKAAAEFRRALDLDLAPLHQTSEVREALRDEVERLGIAFLDLNDAFEGEDGVTGPNHFLDYAHVDVEGHRKLALHLARTQQGKLLPPLPDGWEDAFEAALREWSAAVQPSRERAQAEMSYTLGQYYMLFGNFREALPHCERAARVLQAGGPRADLAFCRRKLQEARAER